MSWHTRLQLRWLVLLAGGLLSLSSSAWALTVTGSGSSLPPVTADNLCLVTASGQWVAGSCSSGSTGITGATANALMIATGATSGTSLGVATNGQLPIGRTGNSPLLATLTPTPNRLSVTNASGSITLTVPDSAQLNVAKLVNLTTNGFVKTGSSDGTLSVDTSTYLTANQTITLSGDVTGSGTTAITATVPNIVKNNAGNTWSTGAQDFGAATSLKLPVAAGATTATNGLVAYDSTNHMLHAAQNGADAKIPQFTITPANDDCVKWVVSGSNYKLGTAGAACGSGSGSGITGATNHGIMIATGATTGTSLGVATNGQLPIGSTGADPVLATLTGTTNRLSVTTGAGSITLNVPDSAQLNVAKLVNLTTNGFVKTSGGDGTLSAVSTVSLASEVTGNLPVTNLNSGTSASSSTFWRGDGTWATPAGGGNVSNTGTPTNGQLALWTSSTVIQGVTTLPAANFPALTGDVTTSAGSLATTLANIPTAVPMAGYLAATAIVAPATPAAGIGRIYVDSTSKNLAVKDDAGVVKHGVQTQSAVSNSFLTAINDAGAVTVAQPSSSNLSDNSTLVKNNVGNTWTTGAQDMGSATSFKVPVAAGATTATNGFLAYDSTAHMLHGAQNGADAKVPQFTVTPSNDDCVKWVVSGSNYKLGTAAAPCGSGGGGAGVPNAVKTFTGQTTVTFAGTEHNLGSPAIIPVVFDNSSPPAVILPQTLTVSTTPPYDIVATFSTAQSGKIVANAYGGSPGGSDTQAQYNNSGAFAGSSGLTLTSTAILSTKWRAANISSSGTVSTPVEWVTTGASTITRTLPAAASGTDSRPYCVFKVDSGAGTLTLAAAGSDVLQPNAVSTKSTSTQWAGFCAREASATSWLVDSYIYLVDLTADVTGLLPGANGGTGLNTTGLTGIPKLSSGTWSIQALTDGQLLIGSTGATPVAASLGGTTNRISVTPGAGTITLSTPQDTHTAATPTFGGMTLSSTAPSLALTDTTGAAKSLTVAVDANVADLRESAGASGSLVALDLTNTRVGFLTAAPTHTTTHGSTSTGSAYYNTSDQTTNFERVVLGWASNNFDIVGTKGGTGSNRNIRMIDSAGFGFQTGGVSSASLTLAGTSGGASLITSTAGIALRGNISTGTTHPAVRLGNSNNYTGTSGAQIHSDTVATFAPTSGTATFGAFLVTPTINQTGGANGVTRGVYVNPTLTAAADFRAIEVASGNAWFNGAVQIGTSTALTMTSGALGMAKMTASGSAPGAAGVKFEVVCGTNAGTAKLIMYAGTSSTAITIVDNVGSGLSGC